MDADIAGVDRISGVVFGCSFRVMNGIGAGFAEKVFENVLAFELRKPRLAVLRRPTIVVRYDGIVVSECAAELLV